MHQMRRFFRELSSESSEVFCLNLREFRANIVNLAPALESEEQFSAPGENLEDSLESYLAESPLDLRRRENNE